MFNQTKKQKLEELTSQLNSSVRPAIKRLCEEYMTAVGQNNITRIEGLLRGELESVIVHQEEIDAVAVLAREEMTILDDVRDPSDSATERRRALVGALRGHNNMSAEELEEMSIKELEGLVTSKANTQKTKIKDEKDEWREDLYGKLADKFVEQSEPDSVMAMARGEYIRRLMSKSDDELKREEKYRIGFK